MACLRRTICETVVLSASFVAARNSALGIQSDYLLPVFNQST